ncbi:MAG: tRNA uridine-5-carboxymethylaminomethyl(34) synthesis GTPase MnmE [Alphaproteobacteria bacterium]
MSETIFALSSAGGKAGVAIIRVSGAQALHSLEVISGQKNPPRRKALYCNLINPLSKALIDKAVVIFFENPASFTGEDVAEYHIHGSPAIIDELLTVLGRQPNHRIAEPGEFTRRAFENGKMDLTEAEAVADLINAQTILQKNQALDQLSGTLKNLYEGWAQRLSKSLAYIEADLEFPDEDDPDGVSREVIPVIDTLIKDLQEHLADNHAGEILRNGVQIAIVGAPNAGKSSLLNALAKRDVAIVSDIAGTTRDIVEVHLDLKGYPVTLSDTAGLRPDDLGDEGQDSIEAEGIRRAMKRAEQADIKILLFDGQKQSPDPYTLALLDEHALVVASKADLEKKFDYPAPIIDISSKSGEGISELLDAILEKIQTIAQIREGPSLTRHRHRTALENCLQALQRSKEAALPELMAEDVRLAIRALGQITGRVDVEDLLDIIFKDFCIGK